MCVGTKISAFQKFLKPLLFKVVVFIKESYASIIYDKVSNYESKL